MSSILLPFGRRTPCELASYFNVNRWIRLLAPSAPLDHYRGGMGSTFYSELEGRGNSYVSTTILPTPDSELKSRGPLYSELAIRGFHLWHLLDRPTPNSE